MPAFDFLDMSVASARCYKYRLVVPDRVGNRSIYSTGSIVKVDANAPAVTLVNPGSTLSGIIGLTASATDSGGSGLLDVKFERSPAGANTWTTIGTSAASPYSASFDTTQVADGNYDLRAVARDNAGGSSVSSVATVAVDNVSEPPVDTTPPSVSLTAPADAATVNGSVTISADASDNVAVTQVEFLVNGNVVGSDTSNPYSISWDSTSLANGPATITARASDGSNTTTSSAHNVTIDNNGSPPPDTTPPSVSLTAPADAATVNGSVTISADASDNVAVTQVEFLVNGNVVGSDTSNPYSISWDSTSLANGPATITARASDGSNTTTSSAHNVTIDNNGSPPPDTTPPSVSLTAPADAATVNGSVTISADASDNVAVTQVEFLVNGNVVGSDTSNPYSISWDSTSLANGPATITARASDGSNTTTSSAHNVTIDNQVTPPGDTTPPTVTLADPGGFLRGVKTLTATASDASGVTQVVFQLSPTGQNTWSSIATDTNAPYSTDFATATVADGVYDFRAVATDPATPGVSSRLTDDRQHRGRWLDHGSGDGRDRSGTATVAATATDAGSGVSQMTFERSPAGQNAWTAISSPTRPSPTPSAGRRRRSSTATTTSAASSSTTPATRARRRW